MITGAPSWNGQWSIRIRRQNRSRSTIEITECGIHRGDPRGIYALTRPLVRSRFFPRSIGQFCKRTSARNSCPLARFVSFLFLLDHLAVLARILHLHSDAAPLPVHQSDVSSLVYAFRVAAAILLTTRHKILRLAGCRFLAVLPSGGSVSIFLRVARATITILSGWIRSHPLSKRNEDTPQLHLLHFSENFSKMFTLINKKIRFALFIIARKRNIRTN